MTAHVTAPRAIPATGRLPEHRDAYYDGAWHKPFGGFKQSGIGREECIEEMLTFTQEKNIHIRYKAAV